MGGNPSAVHSTRLKLNILKYIPKLMSYNEGVHVRLAVNKDIGQCIKQVWEINKLEDGYHTSKSRTYCMGDLLKPENASFAGNLATTVA